MTSPSSSSALLHSKDAVRDRTVGSPEALDTAGPLAGSRSG